MANTATSRNPSVLVMICLVKANSPAIDAPVIMSTSSSGVSSGLLNSLILPARLVKHSR